MKNLYFSKTDRDKTENRTLFFENEHNKQQNNGKECVNVNRKTVKIEQMTKYIWKNEVEKAQIKWKSNTDYEMTTVFF